MNNIHYYTEKEMDDNIRKEHYFRIFKFTKKTEEAIFIAKQASIIAKLTTLMETKYGKDVFVSDNLWPNESLKLEIIDTVFSSTLINDILSFLILEAREYCIGIAFYHELEIGGSTYLGRMLISLREIAVEIPLRKIFEVQWLG